MPYSQIEFAEYARKIRKSRSTLFRWIREGCNLRDPKSVREWVTRNQIRETNIEKARKRRRDKEAKESTQTTQRRVVGSFDPPGNSELPPIGKKGAAAALERLEQAEERAHARLEAALLGRDAVQIAACQDFWLKCSETLRRLDLAVEIARRQEETQIPLKAAEDAVTTAAEWMRIGFATFLSSEAQGLMGIRDVGEWKHYAISLKTRSPVPEWASSQIRETWNVQ
jgi:hypothetical protein